jgi:hypothetical protein
MIMTRFPARTPIFSPALFIAAFALALLPLAGCRVEHNTHNGSDDVKVALPFGGIHVNTDDKAVLSDVGLSGYPGATLDHDEKNNDSAAVNVSFGSFHVGVHVISYRTPDAPDKIFAFYRRDLARYGQVIQCHDGQAVGSPTVTQDGLGCKNDSDTHVGTDEHGNVGELKAGSKQRQHIVTIDRDGSGSKFALIALELPEHSGDGKED